MNFDIENADYSNPGHAADIAYLMNCYASDPMGGGKPLSEEITSQIANELGNIPHAFSIICYVSGKPAGLANCLEAFSTFKCKPLINIHDLMAVNEFRGLGISRLLLQEIEEIARKKACCKITLEVFEGNTPARNLYNKFGFRNYELDATMGKAVFCHKEL